jgi:uncharacterized protein YebE (UPF0316 family)
MASIMDMVFAVIMVTAVAVPIILGMNTSGMDATSKSIFGMLILFLVLGLLYMAARVGGIIAHLKFR